MTEDFPLFKLPDEEALIFDGRPVVDVKKLTLDQWLGLLDSDDYYVQDYQFSTRCHRDEYLSGIRTRTEADFRNLLRRFLISTGSFPADKDGLKFRVKYRPDLHLEFDRRQILYGEAWEGITWVLDLLPSRPHDALAALRAYFLTHIQLLPDGRFDGLFDAMSLIREWYIDSPHDPDEIREMLLRLDPCHFEALIAKLYQDMGYSVNLTQFRNDGGIDILCRRTDAGRRELVMVQCKRHKENIKVMSSRELFGIVQAEKATKGVLVTPGGFTRGTIRFANDISQIELLGGVRLQRLLNEYLGPRWPVEVDRLLAEMERSLSREQPSNSTPP